MRLQQWQQVLLISILLNLNLSTKCNLKCTWHSQCNNVWHWSSKTVKTVFTWAELTFIKGQSDTHILPDFQSWHSVSITRMLPNYPAIFQTFQQTFLFVECYFFSVNAIIRTCLWTNISVCLCVFVPHTLSFVSLCCYLTLYSVPPLYPVELDGINYANP